MSNEALFGLFIGYPILIFSLTVHEYAHAITAAWGGDLTAAYQDRVSLNPLVHIDPVGTVLLPLAGALTGIPLLGWARPVPVVSTNFRRGLGYDVIVTAAGPISNLFIALFAVAGLQFVHALAYAGTHFGFEVPMAALSAAALVLRTALWINVSLFCFNLLPIPPLDGSHIAYRFVFSRTEKLREFFEFYWRWGWLLLWGLMLSGGLAAFARYSSNPLARWMEGWVELVEQLYDRIATT